MWYRPLSMRSSEIELFLRRPAAVPAMYGFRDYVVAGGLMSYGIDLDVFRQVASMWTVFSRAPNSPNCPCSTDQVRTGDQPQDGEGARPRRASDKLLSLADEVIE